MGVWWGMAWPGGSPPHTTLGGGGGFGVRARTLAWRDGLVLCRCGRRCGGGISDGGCCLPVHRCGGVEGRRLARAATGLADRIDYVLRLTEVPSSRSVRPPSPFRVVCSPSPAHCTRFSWSAASVVGFYVVFYVPVLFLRR